MPKELGLRIHEFQPGHYHLVVKKWAESDIRISNVSDILKDKAHESQVIGEIEVHVNDLDKKVTIGNIMPSFDLKQSLLSKGIIEGDKDAFNEMSGYQPLERQGIFKQFVEHVFGKLIAEKKGAYTLKLRHGEGMLQNFADVLKGHSMNVNTFINGGYTAKEFHDNLLRGGG